jgi:nitrite reductase/ring-hydroxylating ferredoxin subunit
MPADTPLSPPGWVPLALSVDILPGTSAGTVCNGVEIVVWRDIAGAVHAWEDRCPHRGMKLSFGFVRGDRIACLYHGWEYEGGGACRYIPSHPDLEVPSSIRVTRFRAIEALGMIWVSPLDDAAPSPLEAGALMALRSLQVDAPVATLADAFAAHGLPGTGPVGDVVQGAATIWLTQGGIQLCAGLQPVDAGASVLHLMVAGAVAPSALAALVPATAALRRIVEGGVVGGRDV